MTVNTVAFVALSNANPFEIVSKVETVLKELVNCYAKDFFKRRGNSPHTVLNASLYSVSIHFGLGAEKRTLSIFFDCHLDYSEVYEGDKVIFSMGTLGKAEEVISKLCQDVLMPLGQTWYCPNDTSCEFTLLG